MPSTGGKSRSLRAIRGAITVARDEPAAIYDATIELLSEIVARNGLVTDDIISVIFTVTPDLTSAFPALGARRMGWLDVPLLCTMEIPVPGALGRCIPHAALRRITPAARRDTPRVPRRRRSATARPGGGAPGQLVAAPPNTLTRCSLIIPSSIPVLAHCVASLLDVSGRANAPT